MYTKYKKTEEIITIKLKGMTCVPMALIRIIWYY